MIKSPCETCGACCAFFRVLFPSVETNGVEGVGVPIGMTHLLNCSQRFMNGTELRRPRCVALEGNVGFGVKCTIYNNRPSTCRNFKMSWENNVGNLQCDRARGVFGLQAFSQY